MVRQARGIASIGDCVLWWNKVSFPWHSKLINDCEYDVEWEPTDDLVDSDNKSLVNLRHENGEYNRTEKVQQ